jgi:hypothetical protein
MYLGIGIDGLVDMVICFAHMYVSSGLHELIRINMRKEQQLDSTQLSNDSRGAPRQN